MIQKELFVHLKTKNALVVAFVLLSPLVAYSSILEAKPVGDLVQLVQEAQFQHKEDGLAFGFNSIKSCLYVSQDFAILKNYCVPKKDYPAKGYTIISLKFGIIDLYQEEIESMFKRDIQISVFPDILKDYIKPPLQDSTIAVLNEILEKLYYQDGPSCWSTNATYAAGTPEVHCSTEGVLHFDLWARETQTLTGDHKAWKQLLETIESSISR